jgi:hypothetical protein
MVSSTTWEVLMPTIVRTIGLAESSEVEGALIGFLTLFALIVSLVGMSSLFVIGSHVADLPFLGQFFGP